MPNLLRKAVNKKAKTPFYLLIMVNKHVTGMEADVKTRERTSSRAKSRLPWIWTFEEARRFAGALARNQRGFSLVELATVVIIAGMIIGVSTVAYYQTTRRTDLKTAAEILKEDIRKVYSLADSGESVTDANGVKHRDQYRIQFHTDDGSYLPVNAYRILKRTWDETSGDYGDWDVVAPERSTAVKVLSGNWIRPTFSSDTQITALTNMSGADGEKGITFESKGSIVQTDAPIGDKTITLSSTEGGSSITITVSMYGSVSN